MPQPLSPPPKLSPAARFWGMALAPMLKWQGLSVRRRIPRLPEPQGPRYGRAGDGPVRLRLLVVGDSSAAGVGVDHQDQALTSQLATHLARHLTQSAGQPCAVGWQLVAASGLNAHQALGLLAAQELRPADVLVTVVGMNDTLDQTPTQQWLQDLDALRGHARHRAKIRHTVHCAPPPLEHIKALPHPLRWYLSAHAHRLTEALRRHVRHSFRRSHFELPRDLLKHRSEGWLASDGFHPNGALYAQWAEDLADHIELDLSDSTLQRAALPSGFHSSGFWAPDTQTGPVTAAGPMSRLPHAPVRSGVLRPTPLGSVSAWSARPPTSAQGTQASAEPAAPPPANAPTGRGRP